MSEKQHSHDALRRIDPVDREQLIASWSDSEAKQALFEEITTMPVDAPTRQPSKHRAVPRKMLVVAVSLGVLSLATVAGALSLWSPIETSTGVACHTSEDSSSIVDAVTGDPVRDCEVLWVRETGQPAPELVAYDNGAGGIEVLPASRQAPQDWQALEPGTAQRPEIIELEAALSDVADGLVSDCHLLPAAEQVATRELDRLGLTDWTVTSDRGEANGTDTCTHFYLEPARQQVVLIPLSDGVVPPADDLIAIFARGLAQTLDQKCVNITEAATVARDAAADAGLTDQQVQIHEVPDPTADCTRADVVVGGTVSVTLRGPTA